MLHPVLHRTGGHGPAPASSPRDQRVDGVGRAVASPLATQLRVSSEL